MVKRKIKELKKIYNRPLLYVLNIWQGGHGNTFQKLLPVFKKNKIAAINWGLVAGKNKYNFSTVNLEKEFDSLPTS